MPTFGMYDGKKKKQKQNKTKTKNTRKDNLSVILSSLTPFIPSFMLSRSRVIH